MLEGFGFVIRPKAYTEFAEKVIYILNNPAIALEMGHDARESILNGFTIEDMVENYGRLYKNLYNEFKEQKGQQ